MAPLAVYPADSGDRLPEALAASPLNIGRPGPRLGASINGASHDKCHRRTCCYPAHKVRLHWCHQHHVGCIGVRGHHGHFGALADECKLTVDEWRKSRRALVSLIRNRLGLVPLRKERTMKLIGFALALALLASPIAAQSHERDKKPTISSDGRFIIIEKAGGLDWALLLDTRTGNTWRLAAVKMPNSEASDTQWFWVPMEVCDSCR